MTQEASSTHAQYVGQMSVCVGTSKWLLEQQLPVCKLTVIWPCGNHIGWEEA